MSENNPNNPENKVANELVDELRGLKSARDQGGDAAPAAGEEITGTIVCDRCGTDRVAKSRPQGLDSLRMRFIPQRPYRCLHCYSRFWQREGLFADKRRVVTFGVLFALAAVIIALNVIGSDMPERPFAETPTSVSDPPAEQMNTAEGGAIVDTEEGLNPDQPKSNEQRQLVEDLDFNLSPLTDNGEAQTMSEAEQAKLAAEQAEAELLNKAKKEEKESLLKVEIAYRIEQWRKAWEAGNAVAYFNSYAEDFVPADNQTPLAWRNQRERRVRPSRDINLMLESFDVRFSDDYQRTFVDFVQHYRSKTYLEISKKRLILKRQGDGWKIYSEQELEAG